MFDVNKYLDAKLNDAFNRGVPALLYVEGNKAEVKEFESVEECLRFVYNTPEIKTLDDIGLPRDLHVKLVEIEGDEGSEWGVTLADSDYEDIAGQTYGPYNNEQEAAAKAHELAQIMELDVQTYTERI